MPLRGETRIPLSGSLRMVVASFFCVFAVLHDPQVGDERAKVKFFENSIPARVVQGSVDLACRIVHVAKDDGLSRTRLLTSR